MAKEVTEVPLDIRGNKLWDDEWDGSDPFSPVGPIRLVVCKVKKQERDWTNGIQVIHHNILPTRLSDLRPNRVMRWEEDLMREETETIAYYLEDKPLGFYEMIGTVYVHEWTSGYEEVEYESELQIRDLKIQPLTFDQAGYFDDDDVLEEESIELTKLGELSGYLLSGYDCDIHPLMPVVDILRHQLNALMTIVSYCSYDGNRVSTRSMSIDECELMIHMMMLEIDSNSEKSSNWRKGGDLSRKIDEEVKKTIEQSKANFE